MTESSVPWFINRTAEERAERYRMLRQAGFSHAVAYRVRDWRPSKIKMFLVLQTPAEWNRLHQSRREPSSSSDSCERRYVECQTQQN